MCSVTRPFEKAIKAGANAIDSVFAAPGDLLDATESTAKSLKPKKPPAPGDPVNMSAGAASPTVLLMPDQTQVGANIVQRRKPRSLLSAAGGGDVSTASTGTTMAKATLGA